MKNTPKIVKTIKVSDGRGFQVVVEPAPDCFRPVTYQDPYEAEFHAADLAFRTGAELEFHDDPDGVVARIALDAVARGDERIDEDMLRRGLL